MLSSLSNIVAATTRTAAPKPPIIHEPILMGLHGATVEITLPSTDVEDLPLQSLKELRVCCSLSVPPGEGQGPNDPTVLKDTIVMPLSLVQAGQAVVVDFPGLDPSTTYYFSALVEA